MWNLINGKKQQHCRAGACSCRFVWNLIIGRANTVRPYDWICYHCFKIRTPTMPSPTRRRGTAPAVDEVVEFNKWQKKGNPRRGFPSCTSCNSPILRKMEQKRVSLSTESDQRRRLWNPPPFEKGGPKLYYLVWNLTNGKKYSSRRVTCPHDR